MTVMYLREQGGNGHEKLADFVYYAKVLHISSNFASWSYSHVHHDSFLGVKVPGLGQGYNWVKTTV